jgi:co-chaperonin GroES (HSP10)
VRVLNNNILVKPIEESKENGLYIPPLFKRKMETARLGEVYACGNQAPVEKGDIIIIGKWAGDEIEYNGEKLLLVKPNGISAIR